MKRLALTVIGLSLSLSGGVQTRAVSDKPLHLRPDRTLKLVEVFRIPGDGEGYVLESIRRLDLDENGCIYTNDSWSSAKKSHLLKFSPDGRFIKDLLRRGEGPGEIQSMFDFAIAGRSLYLHDAMKRKLAVQDLDGAFLKELKKPEWAFDELFGVIGSQLVLGQTQYPAERKTSGLYDIPHKILLLSIDGSAEREVLAIPNQMFFIAQGRGGMSWDPFTAVLGGNLLFVHSIQKYGIKVVDLVSRKIVREFARTFERIPHEMKTWEKDFISKYNAPKRKYESDIDGLLFGDGHLWVKTAAPAEEKRARYDIFDPDGRYLDRFFIDLKGRILKVHGGFVYAEVTDEQDLPALVKYRIDEPLGIR